MFIQKYNRGLNVLEAAKQRISFIFDNYENVIVSVSGGKDSSVLAHLSLLEANRRNRKVGLFFLDEEVVYQSTVEQIEYLMSLYPANTNRLWLQIEFDLTNATSFEESQLKCWEKGKHKKWMRSKNPKNIINPPWGNDVIFRTGYKWLDFYGVIENFERMYNNTAFLVGLRATESPNRWRAVSKNPVYINGETVFYGTQKPKKNVSYYPLYDWNFHDVWKYIYDNNLKYSKIYDYLFKKGFGINEIRISSLIHERSFKSLCELPEFEPETYNKLTERIKGIQFAQETGRNAKVFKAQKLPKNFKLWSQYRDFLLDTYPYTDKKEIFTKRFTRHLENEFVARQQVRQLVLNDYENNVPVINKEDPRIELIKYYMEVL
jgi:predicted phosphoadenosine phosphosulfate sulfurtransferase